MNSNDDTRAGDKELRSYLDGSDGISAAYRQASREEPSEALDAAVLQRAHAANGGTPAAAGAGRQGVGRAQLRGLGALAASMLLGVMLGSMFRGTAPQPAAQSGADEAFVRRNVESALPAETVEVDLRRDEPVEGRELMAREEASGDTAGALAPQRTVISDAELGEIIVTASRIRLPERGAPAYRGSQDEWFQEIIALSRALDETDAQLREEMRLFRARYPEVDLDTALVAAKANAP